MSKQELSRRRFLKGAVAAGSMFSFPTIIPGSALGKNGAVAPSNRIVMGGIGVGNRGRYVLSEFLKYPQVQFAATADCQLSRRQRVKKMVDRHYANDDCMIYRDMFDVPTLMTPIR